LVALTPAFSEAEEKVVMMEVTYKYSKDNPANHPEVSNVVR
jgi:hypothetical protein